MGVLSNANGDIYRTVQPSHSRPKQVNSLRNLEIVQDQEQPPASSARTPCRSHRRHCRRPKHTLPAGSTVLNFRTPRSVCRCCAKVSPSESSLSPVHALNPSPIDRSNFFALCGPSGDRDGERKAHHRGRERRSTSRDRNRRGLAGHQLLAGPNHPSFRCHARKSGSTVRSRLCILWVFDASLAKAAALHSGAGIIRRSYREPFVPSPLSDPPCDARRGYLRHC